MDDRYKNKSSVEEIRERFDGDVERFSNLTTGQSATIDAPLSMDLITRAALAATPNAKTLLDLGCGAGNNTLKLLELKSPLEVDLLDLSEPMLQRAQERVSAVNSGPVRTLHGDFRDIELPDQRYDLIVAAAVLHHLRDDADWRTTFEKLYRITAPGGSVWITDMVAQETGAAESIMRERYAQHLEELGGPEYRDKVFAYIEKEDSPRPLTWQLELLRKVGFAQVDILHKNGPFAAFGAIKASP